MSGTATLTMVADMIEAIIPIITVTRTSHLKRSPWRLRRMSIVVGGGELIVGGVSRRLRVRWGRELTDTPIKEIAQ